MEEKRPSGRTKRQKPVEDGSWDCSVCTYKNSQEAYKCEMCDVRKGTSTRKPRINPQIVAQQVAQQFAGPLSPPTSSTPPPFEDSSLDDPLNDPLLEPPLNTLPPEPIPQPPVVDQQQPLGPPLPPPKVKKEKSSAGQSNKKEKTANPKKSDRPPRLKNVDRSSARSMSVTVGSVTVVITDYQPKKRRMLDQQKSTMSDTSDTSSNASNDIHEERTHSLGEALT